jgi:hypothetical protein
VSYETLFYYINTIVPEGWAMQLEAAYWRYSHMSRNSQPEQTLKVWVQDPTVGQGEIFNGTPVELLERMRTRFAVQVKQVA